MESVHAPEVLGGRSSGLGTTFLKYQTMRSVGLSGAGLKEFCCNGFY
jgi:hypothetical protein